VQVVVCGELLAPAPLSQGRGEVDVFGTATLSDPAGGLDAHDVAMFNAHVLTHRYRPPSRRWCLDRCSAARFG
jgi:hypothetical protein